jgi:hypothetical protein
MYEAYEWSDCIVLQLFSDYVYVSYIELYKYKIYPELRMWLQDDIRMIRLFMYPKHIYVHSPSSCFTDGSFLKLLFMLFHYTDVASTEKSVYSLYRLCTRYEIRQLNSMFEHR